VCLSTLAQVVAIDPGTAVVDVEGGRRRAATTLYPDIAPVEWVLIGAGTILARLTPDEARQMGADLGVDRPSSRAPAGGTSDANR
jgi:hydrogenase maturation factor